MLVCSIAFSNQEVGGLKPGQLFSCCNKRWFNLHDHCQLH